MLDDVINQFADYGLEPAQPLVFGKLTRCKTTQDKGKEKNGWYVLHEHRTEKNETLIFGSFGDWRSGDTQKIKVKPGRMSPEEREVMRARQEDAKRKAAEIAANASRRAANRAAGLFKRMPEKGKSVYLDRKQIVGFKVRYAPRTGAFLVPMCNVRDQIVGLQVIFPAKQEDTGRDKQYWPPGMSKEGAFHLIGPHPEPGEPVLVCEGYATGASLHMATSLTVAIAFDAGNLLPVSRLLLRAQSGASLALLIHTEKVLLFMSTPIIPWMGGKRRLADRLIPLFPPHECYVEVFAGGAALYFMRPQAAPVEVLNDINGDLVTLYRVVQNHLEEFVRQFKWALSSRQVFEWQKMTRPETLTDIQRAARFFYLQHHAFAGKVTGQTFGTATTGPAINLLRIEENLSAAWQRLSGTYVENLPWLDCAERYDRPHTFHYMDPPYWQTAGYGVDFPFENYERMADFMRSCKGKVMVSINDHPDIRGVFDGFHFETVDIRYSTTNQRQGRAEVSGELVIMNWEPAALGGLF